ncbi:MAG: hypothetical protein HYX59_09195 [Elusimicrobia bacterium]|nr:hypothetical protein [Elusimicrobiota bacterium]
MDTKKDSAVSDVPTFKVARVGNDRKRKGGGFSFLRGGGARGAWSGAAGGSGAGGAGAAAGLAGMTLSKGLLIFLVAVGGLGAAGLGRMLGNTGGQDVKKKAFSMSREAVKLEGDTSNLPSTANTIPNSLGYLSGSMDGLTPEERAKREADAAAAAEAQRIADEEAAKKAATEQNAANAVDPNAMLASAKADGGSGRGGSAFGKKFGSLSSSMGGGSSLSGGAGLSGGVNRSFGGGGSLGKAAPGGQLSAMKGTTRPSYSKAGGARMASSKTKGFARKQLANANAYSRRGSAAGKGETAASDAGTAFDNNPGAGNVISGPGVGKGSGSSTGADSTPNLVDNGGPTGNADPTVDCGPNKYQTADGGCADINTNNGVSATKAIDMMAKMAMGLLAAIAVISAIKAATDSSGFLALYGPMLGAIIGLMGAMITMLGVAIIAMGDYAQGTVFTLTGAVIAAVAFVPAASSYLTSGTMLIASAAGLVLGQAASMLGSKKGGDAPEAAQQ